jgi:hypothetical protein
MCSFCNMRPRSKEKFDHISLSGGKWPEVSCRKIRWRPDVLSVHDMPCCSLGRPNHGLRLGRKRYGYFPTVFETESV